MSYWTHVNSSILFDGFDNKKVVKSLYEDLGQINTFISLHSLSELYDSSFFDEKRSTATEHSEISLLEFGDLKNCKLPCGSEGSLLYNIVEYSTPLPICQLSIWGDLRDYRDTEAILKFFNDLVTETDFRFVRSGILEISDEDESFYYYFCDDSKKWVNI
jgi:hypothetical protein